MRYEIHKFFPNKDHQEKSAWATQEFFQNTHSGYVSAKERIAELRTLDKAHKFRLVFVDFTVLDV